MEQDSQDELQWPRKIHLGQKWHLKQEWRPPVSPHYYFLTSIEGRVRSCQIPILDTSLKIVEW